MAETPIRFGILGCDQIACKLCRAITIAPNATLCAVASHSLENACKFAFANDFPSGSKAYNSYEALLDDPYVDAVYVPLPTSLHVPWAVLIAQKKKHLLLEKPVALNADEFDKIIEACESNGVQLMDSTMWIHHPRTAKMAESLSNAQHFGQLKSIHTVFTFFVDPDSLKNDIRGKPDFDALGVEGWYCVGAILWAANYELPKTVIASREPVLNEGRVILSCGASLHWEDGKVATFHCSFLSNLTMDITVVGTKGTLHVNDFIIPYQETMASFTEGSGGFDKLVTRWASHPREVTMIMDLPQEAYMVREFARLVGAIKFNNLKPEKKWPTISRKTQLVLDAVKASIERGFEPVPIQE